MKWQAKSILRSTDSVLSLWNTPEMSSQNRSEAVTKGSQAGDPEPSMFESSFPRSRNKDIQDAAQAMADSVGKDPWRRRSFRCDRGRAGDQAEGIRTAGRFGKMGGNQLERPR